MSCYYIRLMAEKCSKKFLMKFTKVASLVAKHETRFYSLFQQSSWNCEERNSFVKRSQ